MFSNVIFTIYIRDIFLRGKFKCRFKVAQLHHYMQRYSYAAFGTHIYIQYMYV